MRDTVFLVSRRGLGTTAPGDAGFGVQLLEKLLHTLEKQPEKPRALCFWTEGVHCLVEGSPLLLGLQLLAGMGVRLVACGTCVRHYGLEGRIAIGEVLGMDAIVPLLGSAGRVVTL